MTELSAVSVTEVGGFRDCRRNWYLSSQMLLEPKSKPQTNLWFGTMIHVALEEYFRHLGHDRQTRKSKAFRAYVDFYEQSTDALAAEWGTFWAGIEPDFSELYYLGCSMLENYVEYDYLEGNNWILVEAEQRHFVDIPGTTVRLAAKMDLVVRDRDGRVGIVDHKTAAVSPSLQRILDIDDQLTGYAYVWWRLTGEIPWTMYDVLIKRAPEEPRVLKSGKLSVDKSQKITLGAYLAAGGDDAEMIAALEERGWSDFFQRVTTERNIEQLRSYEEHLLYTVRDMEDCVISPELAYYNPSQQRCPQCPYLLLCHALEDGTDVSDILTYQYKRGEPRY